MQTKQVQLDMNEVRKNKFFIATPCYGGQLTEPYFRSVVKLMTFFKGTKCIACLFLKFRLYSSYVH